MDKQIIDRAKEIEKRLDMLASDINFMGLEMHHAEIAHLEISDVTQVWVDVYRAVRRLRGLIDKWELFPQSESAG